MRVADWKSMNTAAGAILGIAFFLSATAALPEFRTAQVTTQEVVLALDPAQTKVHWTLGSALHTVHGTFALKSGTVRFDPETGKAGGEIIVLAVSGESGNSSRDQRMHKEILETAKFPEAVFRPEQIDGKVTQPGSSDVQLRGVISLHGSEHEITVRVHAELAGDHWSGTANFDVPYIQWGMKDPSNWLLKVKPVVNVELAMTGSTKHAN
jgi:polyisoprenoid-binding protein YceI